MDLADALIFALLAVIDVFVVVQLRRRRTLHKQTARIERNLRLANQFQGS